MNLGVVDMVAWGVMRCAGLIQGVVCDAVLPHVNDEKLRLKLMMIGISGYHMFDSKVEDVPEVVRPKMLTQGRILLVILIHWVADDIVDAIMAGM